MNSHRPALRVLLLLACALSAIGAAALLGGCLGTDKTAEADTEYRMRGDFRKGPFAANSDVRISMLNKSGEPTGRNYRTSTENDSGDFHVTVAGGVAEFSCTGTYFDEVTGTVGNTALRLDAVAQVPEDGKRILHINAFTHMACLRIKRLMVEGKGFAAATAQAETELHKELGIANGEGGAPAAGTALDLLGGNNPHTLYLFGVSGILGQAALKDASGQAGRSAEKMQVLLDSIAADLERDGKLGEGLKKTLAAAETSLDPDKARKNLEAWAKSKGSNAVIPDLSHLVDTDKDGKPNDTDPDDDGDKVSDLLDCAPLDSTRQMVSADGQYCVAMYAPAPILAIPGDKQVRVTWDLLPGEARYTLLYSEGEFFNPSAAIKIEDARPERVVGGLGNGKAYSFAVRTAYGDRVSALSAPAKAIPVGAISGFTAASGTAKVTLQWTAAEGASSYNLYFREITQGAAEPGKTASKPGVDLSDSKITAVSSPYTVMNLKDGARYAFALTSVSGGAESPLGDTVTAMPIRAPAKTEVASRDGMIIVTWDSVPGALSYNLFWSKGDSTGTEGTFRENRVSPDTIKSLGNGSLYSGRAQAVVSGGVSALGPNGRCVPLATPRGLTAKVGTGRISLSWKPSEGALSYLVYYHSATGATVRGSASAPPFELKGLPNGTPYSFRVSSTNTGFESFLSDSLRVSPLAAPGAARTETLDGAVALSWDSVPGATQYSIYYGQGNSVDTATAKVTLKELGATLNGLVNDSPYAFVLRAENAFGESVLGPPVVGLPIGPPASFTATAETDKVTLKWDVTPGNPAYNVNYAAASGMDKQVIRIPNVMPPYTITGLDNSGLYTFAVQAVRSDFTGPLSLPQSVVYASSTVSIGKGGISDSTATGLALALDGSDRLYVAFVDRGKLNATPDLLRVLTFKAGSWVPQGKPADRSPGVCCFLETGPSDMPYLAYGDADLGGKLTVKAFGGTAWSTIGEPAATDAKVETVAFGIDALGIPYFAYNDSAHFNHVSARKLAGSKWAQVGATGFSTNPPGGLALAFSKANHPLLSNGNIGAITPVLMAFDGNAWVTAADPAAMLARATPGRLPLGVSSSDLIYTAFPDRSYQYKATVVSCSGWGWSPVGQPGFSETGIQAICLRVDAKGVLFVAFADDAHEGRISVMKFSGGAWVYACRPGFSKGRAGSINLAIGKSGVVYTAFTDAGEGGKAMVVRLNQ